MPAIPVNWAAQQLPAWTAPVAQWLARTAENRPATLLTPAARAGTMPSPAPG